MSNEMDIRRVIERIPYQMAAGKTFLISGADGFLGSYVVDTLMYLNHDYLKHKCTILALCRNQKRAKAKFQQYLRDAFFRLYVQNVEHPFSGKETIHYILHAASHSASAQFEKIPAEILNANIIGAYNLLELAKERKAEGFLFFSSGAVYGDIPKCVCEVVESDVFSMNYGEIRNCYAEGKRSGEALCRAYWKQYGVPAKIVRIGHTYGPGINLEDGHVFSDFVRSVCRRQNLMIKGNRNDVRPFCYITDAVTAFFLILFKGKSGEAYNMVNRKETVTIQELAEKIILQAFPDRELNIEYLKAGEEAEGNYLEVNTDKLEKLGWRAETDIVEGFKRTVESFEEKCHG